MNKKIKVAVAALSVVMASSAFAGRTSSIRNSFKTATRVADQTIDLRKAADEGQRFYMGNRSVVMIADTADSGSVTVRIKFEKSPEMNEQLKLAMYQARDSFTRGGIRTRAEQAEDGCDIIVLEAKNEAYAEMNTRAILNALERVVKQMDEEAQGLKSFRRL